MTVALRLSQDDAYIACEAIASRRYWKHCECEPDVGYTCGFCKRHFEQEREDDYVSDVIRRYGEMLFVKLTREQPLGS